MSFLQTDNYTNILAFEDSTLTAQSAQGLLKPEIHLKFYQEHGG